MFNADGLRVAVIENGTAHLHKVTVTRDFGTSEEVRDGVKAGDQVILNPPSISPITARCNSLLPAKLPRK